MKKGNHAPHREASHASRRSRIPRDALIKSFTEYFLQTLPYNGEGCRPAVVSDHVCDMPGFTPPSRALYFGTPLHGAMMWKLSHTPPLWATQKNTGHHPAHVFHQVLCQARWSPGRGQAGANERGHWLLASFGFHSPWEIKSRWASRLVSEGMTDVEPTALTLGFASHGRWNNSLSGCPHPNHRKL